MGRKTSILHFRLPETTLDTLDLAAMASGVTRSELIRKLIDEAELEHMVKYQPIQVLVRLDYMQHRKIQWCAAKAKITISEIMRRLIEKELK